MNPQPVLSPLTTSAIFLVAVMGDGAEPAVRELLADLSGLQRTVGFRVPEGRLAVVAGIGSEAWDRPYSGPRPAGLRPFRPLHGAKHHAPATPGDLLFHIRAEQPDLCFELASQVMDRLRDWVTVVDEVHGFKYFEVRDLLGFVDGTENPVGPRAAAAVTVGDEDPSFVGSSYVAVQKYVHDLAAWNALPVEQQEQVIGRTKLSNVELPDDVKPPNSHVALNTIAGPDGEQLQVPRDNMPFGTVGSGELGTYYIAYSRSPDVTETMLDHMFVGDPPGNYDRILDFPPRSLAPSSSSPPSISSKIPRPLPRRARRMPRTRWQTSLVRSRPTTARQAATAPWGLVGCAPPRPRPKADRPLALPSVSPVPSNARSRRNTRDRILEAAMEVFAEEGFSGATISEVERRVGLAVGTGSLHRHFPSKEALLRAAAEREVGRFREEIEATWSRRPLAADPMTRRLQVYEQALRNLRRFDGLFRLMLNEGDRVPELRQAIWAAVQRPVADDQDEEHVIEAIAIAALGGYHLFSIMQGRPFEGVDQHDFLRTLVEITEPRRTRGRSPASTARIPS